jgi:hypothetical protein
VEVPGSHDVVGDDALHEAGDVDCDADQDIHDADDDADAAGDGAGDDVGIGGDCYD